MYTRQEHIISEILVQMSKLTELVNATVNEVYRLAEVVNSLNFVDNSFTVMNRQPNSENDISVSNHIRPVTPLQQETTSSSENFNSFVPANDISTVQSSFQHVSKPMFCGKSSDAHPMDFLHELDDYIQQMGGTENQKLNRVLTCLQGEPRVFARAFKYKYSTFADFKKLFRNRYWALEKQREVCEKLQKCSYKSSRGSSHMAEYFLRWLAKSNYLDVSPSKQSFLRQIAYHFPPHVQQSLRRFGDGTLEAALIILEEEDKLENDNYQSRRRPNSNPSWRSHNQRSLSTNRR
jgi:hypothetical protein